MVMALFDRVFVSTCWDSMFPSSYVTAKPRVGSDHTLLVVDTGAIRPPKVKQFRFEKVVALGGGF
jgi:hypothetical protein